MATPNRLARFGDWGEIRPLLQSGKRLSERPFYAGSSVHDRMERVRRAIEYIRSNWTEYPQLMRELRELMESTDPAAVTTRGDSAERMRALFRSVKRWSDEGVGGRDQDFSAIRLYTSDAGYNSIFNVINLAFRTDELTKDFKTLRCAVFLVELLNIDLFNYREHYPPADGFVGTVYRGMHLTDADLRRFYEVAARPVEERYLAVPLAMASASLDREKALEFAVRNSARNPRQHALLWVIHVAGLEETLLSAYRDRFPTSVVTSLCAVPIDDLSDYPTEKEVLLRGPFFQIVHLREEHLGETPLHVLHAVMLNSNRDHPSSVQLDAPAAQRARELFRTMVTARRAFLCAERADDLRLASETRAFRDEARRHEHRLEGLLA